MKLSQQIIALSERLDGLRFAGLDQNPHGIRDDLFCMAGDARRLEALNERLDISSGHFQHGNHECPKSPTNACIYVANDYDDCIFCHDPSERK